MKMKKKEFFIDEIILAYQVLSKKKKSSINVFLGVFLAALLIGEFYNGGEVIGAFFYDVTH